MKTRLLLLFFCASITRLLFAQTDFPIVNPSFEFPGDSNKLKCDFNNLKGYGWKIDSCMDSGREDSTKFGDPASANVAFDGGRVGYTDNQDPHTYQVVDIVPATGALYSLTAEARASYPLSDTTEARIFFSIFSGTDTAKRTIVDSAALMLITATPDWQEVKLTHDFPSNYAGQHVCIEFGGYYSAAGTSSWMYWDMFTLKKGKSLSIPSQQVLYSAYPNPSKGIFQLTTGFSNVNFDVYNVTGKLLISGHFNQNISLNMSEFSKGIYFLKLKSSGLNQNVKLILQ
jgi:hypothetical protein